MLSICSWFRFLPDRDLSVWLRYSSLPWELNISSPHTKSTRCRKHVALYRETGIYTAKSLSTIRSVVERLRWQTICDYKEIHDMWCVFFAYMHYLWNSEPRSCSTGGHLHCNKSEVVWAPDGVSRALILVPLHRFNQKCMSGVGAWENAATFLNIGHTRELFYKDNTGWTYVGTYKVIKSAPLDFKQLRALGTQVCVLSINHNRRTNRRLCRCIFIRLRGGFIKALSYFLILSRRSSQNWFPGCTQ